VKLALAIITVVLCLVISVGGSYWLSLTAIEQSQHNWCDTLTLLTANANPSSESSKVFYAKLVVLERKFGC
jgi:hypothetical protein